MKNILIPTTLKEDTLHAVQTVSQKINGTDAKVVLLMLSEMPDGIVDLLFTPTSRHETSPQEQKVLSNCRAFVETRPNISLKVHHQYGVSGPLMRNILHHYEIDLVVLAPSYKQETNYLHRQAVKVLNNSKCPILHLPVKIHTTAFDQAIYVDHAMSRISMEEIQQMLKREFDVRVVGQAKLEQNQTLEELSPVLTETILKNNINLLIETRNPGKKIRKSEPAEQELLAEKLGVPLLSLCDN